ncbi:MAG: hypothetical protein WCX74_00195 [Candidatus Paceibacterota bacterium]
MKIKIPYRFRLILPILGWAIICFIFNLAVVFNTIPLSPKMKGMFLLISLIFLSISFIITLLSLFSVKPFSANSKALDTNIKNGKLVSGISTAEVVEVLHILCDYPRKCFKNAFLTGAAYFIVVMIWQSIFLPEQFNFFVLAMIETITISLLMGFSLFWPQFQSFDIIKQCRNILILKDLKMAKTYSSSIRTKILFVIFYFLNVIMLYILSTLCEAQAGNIIFFSGIVMIIFISVILLFYLDNSLKGFIESIKKVSKEGLTIFSTGSLDEEFVDLSNNLNEISIQLYSSKQEAITSKKEMEKRVEELEKFFELTVGREEKMVELKKENAELRKKLEKSKK